MSRLLWDQLGTKQFITGVDRGVLYKADNTGVVWNGLTSFEEVMAGASVTQYYYEGLPFVQVRTPDDFSGILKAYTFPAEFEEFDGTTDLYGRVWFTGQPVKKYFGLSYRTHMGDDLNTDAPFYQIHVLYNLMADPTNRQYNTMAAATTPIEFSWNLSGIPVKYPGIRPTCHMIFDSRYMHPELLGIIEEILYGVDDIDGNLTEEYVLDGGQGPFGDQGAIIGGLSFDYEPGPRLPTFEEIIKIATEWPGIKIVDNGDGTWTATGDPMYIKMTGPDTFQIDDAIVDMLDPDTYIISSP